MLPIENGLLGVIRRRFSHPPHAAAATAVASLPGGGEKNCNKKHDEKLWPKNELFLPVESGDTEAVDTVLCE